jgi:hypothetical protein
MRNVILDVMSRLGTRLRRVQRQDFDYAEIEIEGTLTQAEKCAHCEYPPSIDFLVCSPLSTG